jgi:hypothetical protein
MSDSSPDNLLILTFGGLSPENALLVVSRKAVISVGVTQRSSTSVQAYYLAKLIERITGHSLWF